MELTGTLEPAPKQIIDNVKSDRITEKLLADSFERAAKIYDALSADGTDSDSVARGTEFVKQLKSTMRRRLAKKGKKKAKKSA